MLVLIMINTGTKGKKVGKLFAEYHLGLFEDWIWKREKLCPRAAPACREIVRKSATGRTE